MTSSNLLTLVLAANLVAASTGQTTINQGQILKHFQLTINFTCAKNFTCGKGCVTSFKIHL
jgi:hypothetical protein